jgi:hypothetical protein
LIVPLMELIQMDSAVPNVGERLLPYKSIGVNKLVAILRLYPALCDGGKVPTDYPSVMEWWNKRKADLSGMDIRADQERKWNKQFPVAPRNMDTADAIKNGVTVMTPPDGVENILQIPDNSLKIFIKTEQDIVGDKDRIFSLYSTYFWQGQPMDASAINAISEACKANLTVINAAIAAVNSGHLVLPRPQHLFNSTPYQSELNVLEQLLVLNGVYQELQNDPVNAINAYLMCIKLSRLVGGISPLNPTLGIRNEIKYWDKMSSILLGGDFTIPQLDQIWAWLVEIKEINIQFETIVENKANLYINSLKLYPVDKVIGQCPLENSAGLNEKDKEPSRITAAIVSLKERQLAWLKLDLKGKMQSAIEQTDNPIANAFMRYIDSWYNLFLIDISKYRLTMVACLMKKYKTIKGVFPDDLDSMGKALNCSIPMDPYFDVPYKYEKNQDRIVVNSACNKHNGSTKTMNGKINNPSEIIMPLVQP